MRTQHELSARARSFNYVNAASALDRFVRIARMDEDIGVHKRNTASSPWLVPAGERVLAELRQYFSHLPETPKNLALKQRTNSRLLEIDGAVGKLVATFPADQDADPVTAR